MPARSVTGTWKKSLTLCWGGAVVSARIWLCLYWFDHQMSLGTGRPIVLRDESSIRHCRLLLSHPMASPTDVRLISQVELIAQKSEHPGPTLAALCLTVFCVSSNLRDTVPIEWASQPQYTRIHPACEHRPGQVVDRLR